MPDDISSPLLTLVKEQGLIDDLQYEEVAGEFKRTGKPVMQILQDFGIMDLDAILQVISNYLGAEIVSLNDREFSPQLLKSIPSNTARMYRCRACPGPSAGQRGNGCRPERPRMRTALSSSSRDSSELKQIGVTSSRVGSR